MAVVTGQAGAGTIYRRHELMWRQLSVLWGLETIPVSPDALTGEGPFAACSAVITSERLGDIAALKFVSTSARSIVFLNQTDVDPSTWSLVRPQDAPADDADDRYTSYRLELKAASDLGSGLPRAIAMYGRRPRFVPLTTAAVQGRPLVTMDGQPVVVESDRRLLVGAEPWQLGSPTNPYLYPVIRSWVEKVAGIPTRGFTPLAAIRFDDLPATAPELLRRSRATISRLDVGRARLLRRLRLFAGRHGLTLNLMYSTHFWSDERLQPIADVMPKSVAEIRKGIADGAIELGSHGMVHLDLRSTHGPGSKPDHREFLELTETETEQHITAGLAEIERTFGVRPTSFVAPAWAYRKNVTKVVAAKFFPIVIDSSQHVETGACVPLGGADPETDSISIVETFRPGYSVANFGNQDFWKCFAAAGIPVHYMQHHEKARDTLRHALLGNTSAGEAGGEARGFGFIRAGANSPNRSFRVASLVLLATEHAADRQMVPFLIRASRCSIYSVVRALLSAGYRCVALSGFSSELWKSLH